VRVWTDDLDTSFHSSLLTLAATGGALLLLTLLAALGVSYGPSPMSIWRKSLRTWVQSHSGGGSWSDRASMQRALIADRPVVIDVVTDIEVLAPPPVK
jgi:hypothetical protein